MSRACNFGEEILWPTNVVPSGKFYPIPGVGRLPRVTSIIDSTVGIWGRFLNDWYARTERQAVLETVKQQFSWAAGMDPGAFVELVEGHLGQGRAAVREMEKAADIGTEAHKAIQAHLRRELGLPYEMPILGDGATLAYMAWEEWWNKAGFTPVKVEQVIYDGALKYAGTIDLIAEKNGKTYIVDWKSSNYILLKHHIQVASYVHAAGNWQEIAGGLIVRVPKTLERIDIEERALGEMFDPEKKVEFRVGFADLMDGFRAARTLYRIFIERDADGSVGGSGLRSE